MKYFASLIAFSVFGLMLTACDSGPDKRSNNVGKSDSEPSDSATDESIQLTSSQKAYLKQGYSQLLEGGVWYGECSFTEASDSIRGYWGKSEWVFDQGSFMEAFDSFENEQDCLDARLVENYEKIQTFLRNNEALNAEIQTAKERISAIKDEITAAVAEAISQSDEDLRQEFEAQIELLRSEIERIRLQADEWQEEFDRAVAELDQIKKLSNPVVSTGAYAFVESPVMVESDYRVPYSPIVVDFIRLDFDLTGQREGDEGEYVRYFTIAASKKAGEIYLQPESSLDSDPSSIWVHTTYLYSRYE